MADQTVFVILAGGRGSRLGGRDKALTPFCGAPLLHRVIARLGIGERLLAINANGDAARFTGLGVPILQDRMPDRPGPLAGLDAAMAWACHQRAGRVVIVSTDLPFLPRDLAPRFLASPIDRVVLAASDARMHPTIGAYPVALADDLSRAFASGERRIGIFAARHAPLIEAWPSTPIDPFTNLNTPEDWAEAERFAAANPCV